MESQTCGSCKYFKFNKGDGATSGCCFVNPSSTLDEYGCQKDELQIRRDGDDIGCRFFTKKTCNRDQVKAELKQESKRYEDLSPVVDMGLL